MSSLNCSLLVHTFNGYESLWEGLINSYRKHWNNPIQLYLGTNTPNHENKSLSPFKVIYSGIGEWSDRLKILLQQITTEYIIYCQEDHWLKDSPPDIKFLLGFMQNMDLYKLQISPITQYYTLYGSSIPLFFYEKAKSKYLVNHQPTIWKKEFLMSCLEPNENPWDNEYKATCRLWGKSEQIHRKLAIWPCDWFTHEHISKNRGKVIENS